MYPEAAVNLPEFAEFFAAVSSETERRASVAAAKKETAEKERAAAQAKKDAEEAQAKKDAEEWITKHGSAYLKRLLPKGTNTSAKACPNGQTNTHRSFPTAKNGQVSTD